MMSTDTYFYKPELGHGLKHNPFSAIIAPRPIGWISSISAAGHVNLAPYSFFNALNYSPPLIGFSSVGYKDSVKNIAETGEFCWNFVSRESAETMNITSASVAEDCNEFEIAKIPQKTSRIVKPPHVANAPVVMECKKTQITELTDLQGKGVDSYLVVGEVVGVHIQDAFIQDGVFTLEKAQPLLRAGGLGDYFTISDSDKFEMLRPTLDSVVADKK